MKQKNKKNMTIGAIFTALVSTSTLQPLHDDNEQMNIRVLITEHPNNSYISHADNIADILEMYSEELSWYNKVPEQLLNYDFTSLYSIQNLKYIENMFSNYDVVNFSVGSDNELNTGKFDIDLTNEQIFQLDQIFQKSNTIFVKSAGNHGETNIERYMSEPGSFSRMDSYIVVGAAEYDYNSGALSKAGYSSNKTSISFLTINPYSEGYRYALYDKDAQLDYTKYPKFIDCTKEAEQTKSEELQEIKNNCAMELGLEYIDKYGESNKVPGTSFSTPVAAAYYTDMLERYPEMSEYDIVAASYIASIPLKSNDRNIMSYDDNGAGFGVLDYEYLNEHINNMSQILKNKQDLETREIWTYSPEISFYSKEYQIPIDDDILPLQTMFILKFKDGKVPDNITVISPNNGGKINLSPSKNRGKTEISLTSTPGFFGVNSKGNWEILIDQEGVELESAQITIAGSQRNGLIETYAKEALANGAKSQARLNDLNKKSLSRIEKSRAKYAKINLH